MYDLKRHYQTIFKPEYRDDFPEETSKKFCSILKIFKQSYTNPIIVKQNQTMNDYYYILLYSDHELLLLLEIHLMYFNKASCVNEEARFSSVDPHSLFGSDP